MKSPISSQATWLALSLGLLAAPALAQTPADAPAAPADAPAAPAEAPAAPAEAPAAPAEAPAQPAAPAEAPADAPAAAPEAPPAPDPAPAAPPPAAQPVPAPAGDGVPPVSPLDGEGSAVDEIGRRSRRLADELRSPFCPGKTLMTCTSYQAFELRREMREMIERGLSDAEIIDTLVQRHGEEVRNPPQPWYTILVPVLPFIVLAVLLFWIFRKWKERDQRTPEQAPQALDPADVERLAKLQARTKAEFE